MRTAPSEKARRAARPAIGAMLIVWAVTAPAARAAVSLTNTVNLQTVLESTVAISASGPSFTDTDTSDDAAQVGLQASYPASATTVVNLAPIAQVPVLSPWGLVASCVLLAGTALLRLRHRQSARGRLSGG